MDRRKFLTASAAVALAPVLAHVPVPIVDDALWINARLKAESAAGFGGYMKLPPGKYHIASALKIPRWTLLDMDDSTITVDLPPGSWLIDAEADAGVRMNRVSLIDVGQPHA